MPIYEYKCSKCGEKFEQRRSFFSRGKDKADCPKCGSDKSERVFSAPLTVKSDGGSCGAPRKRGFGWG